MNKFAMAVTGLLIGTLPTWADYSFSQNAFGVRALGMGGAASAHLNDSESIFYNPAVPILSESPQFKFEMGQRLATPFVAASGSGLPSPFRWGAIVAWDNAIQGTQLNEFGQPVASGKTLGWQFTDLRLAYPISLFGFHFALTGHAIQETLVGQKGSLFSAEGSAYKEISIFNTPVQLSAQLNNVVCTGMQWTTNVIDSIPAEAKLGVAVSAPNRKWTTEFDGVFRYRKDPLSGTPVKNYAYFVGGEYWALGNPLTEVAFAVRAGLRNGDITTGLSAYFYGCMADFAYVQPQNPIFESEYRLSMGWTFSPLTPAPPVELLPTAKSLDLPKFSLPGDSLFGAVFHLNRNEIEFTDVPHSIPVLIDDNQFIAKPNSTQKLIQSPHLVIIPITATSGVTLSFDFGESHILHITGNLPPKTVVYINNLQLSNEGPSLDSYIPVTDFESDISINIRTEDHPQPATNSLF